MNNEPQTHPERSPFFFQSMRDAIEGEKAIKSGDENYLIRPAAMQGAIYDEEWEAYKKRADYLPVVDKTKMGLIGRAFNKTPEIDLEPIDLNMIDAGGRSFARLLRYWFGEVLTLGSAGVLIDVTDEGEPIAVTYPAENVLDWHYEQGKLIYLSLDESRDIFDNGSRERIRVERRFKFDDSGNVYSQEVTFDGLGKEIEGPATYPTANAETLRQIPFVVIGELGACRSTLSALADLAVSYYDASAQYHWALSKAASPTFVIEWDKDTDMEQAGAFIEAAGGGKGGIAIGSGHALQLLGSTAKFVEPSGAGFVQLAGRLSELKSHMIAAGARGMADQAPANLAAETARIAMSGEGALLSDLVGAFEIDVNDVLRFVALFAGTDPQIVQLSRDFFNEPVSASDLMQIVAGVTAGVVPREVFYEALRRGNWTTATDEELAEMERESPVIF